MTNELKQALLNDSWTPFGKLPKEVQDAFFQAKNDGAEIECLNSSGCWGKTIPREPFYKGLAYRVTTASAPADPTPFTDLKPVTHNGNPCVILDGIHVPLSILNIGAFKCIGFVYGNDVRTSITIKGFTRNGDIIGYDIVPPSAVRFRR